MMRQGSWWVTSKLDPRWDTDGRGTVGCFSEPPEVASHVERMRPTLGEPPSDLEWGYMKD